MNIEKPDLIAVGASNLVLNIMPTISQTAADEMAKLAVSVACAIVARFAYAWIEKHIEKIKK
jgi:hypothetical protein